MSNHTSGCPYCLPVDGVQFWPWRGPNYGQSALGARVLVMGESTYQPTDYAVDQFTQEYDTEGPSWFAHHNSLAYSEGDFDDPRFSSKWFGLFLNRPPRNSDERRRVLYNVAFWNYSDAMLDASGMMPSEQDLVAANGKLRSVLAALQPHLAVLLSTRLWTNLGSSEDAFDAKLVSQTPRYETQKFEARTFLRLPHPRGRYWRNDCVRPAFLKALREVGGEIPAEWTR